jgi:hypothetical protein
MEYYIQRDVAQKSVKYPKKFFVDTILIEFLSQENIYKKFSFLCLFLDEYPKVSILKNSIDKKRVGCILGCKVLLSNEKKKKIFLNRLKSDFSVVKQRFRLDPNSISEFGGLYHQFSGLSGLWVTLNFSEKSKEENLILLSAWGN